MTRGFGYVLACGVALSLLTTPALAQEFTKRSSVTYAVADLVVPVGSDLSDLLEARTEVNKEDGAARRKKEPQRTREEELIRLICKHVAPKSWEGQGGLGEISYFPLGMALVVTQTPEVQEQVRELLTTLRHLQDVEVAMELRIVEIAPDLLDKICRKLGIALKEEVQELQNSPVSKSVKRIHGAAGTARLTDRQVFALLQEIQGSRTASVMQAPKVTTHSGQRAVIEVSDKETYMVASRAEGGTPHREIISSGVRFAMQPAVSPDRRHVRLQFQGVLSTKDTPQVPIMPVQSRTGDDKAPLLTQFVQLPRYTTLAVERTFKLADSETMLLSCGTQLKKVPIHPSLSFLNGRVCQREQEMCILLLVTPRIIINEEEEKSFTGPQNVGRK